MNNDPTKLALSPEARKRLESLLLEGLEGEDSEIKEDYWADLLRRIDEGRLQMRKPGASTDCE
jgi:hypothetical protein